MKRTFTTLAVNESQLNVPSDCLYAMSAQSRFGLENLMSIMFNGKCGTIYPFFAKAGCGYLWLQQIYNGGRITFETLNNTFQQFATSMTNFLRLEGAGSMHATDFYGRKPPGLIL